MPPKSWDPHSSQGLTFKSLPNAHVSPEFAMTFDMFGYLKIGLFVFKSQSLLPSELESFMRLLEIPSKVAS